MLEKRDAYSVIRPPMSSLIRTVASADPMLSAVTTAAARTASARISPPLRPDLCKLNIAYFSWREFLRGNQAGILSPVDILPRRALKQSGQTLSTVRPNPTIRGRPGARGFRHNAGRAGD